MTSTLTATEIAARTPASRNRYIDFLRVASLLVVVLGHWLMAAIVIRDGELVIGPPVSPMWAQLLTWAFQVMPIFFIVGGFANAASWRSAQRRGVAYGTWVRERARRLFSPALVLVAVWVPLAIVAVGLGFDAAHLRDATKVVAVPMWFLAVYMVVVAAAPTMLRLHERFGLAVPLALMAVAVGLDVANRGFDVRFTGSANYLPVWLAVHQLGFFWRDGALEPLRRHAGRIAAAVVAVMAALTFFGPYPIPMVGVGTGDSNNSPPTVLMIVLGVAQLAVVLRAEPAMQRWLARARVWAGVVAAASVAMTVYLWHMTVLILTVAALWALDHSFLHIEPLGGDWLATRPVWLAGLAVLMVPVLAAFRRFERPGSGDALTLPAGRAALGAALLAAGIGYFAFVGMVIPGMPYGVPLQGIVPTVAGAALLRLRRRTPAAA